MSPIKATKKMKQSIQEKVNKEVAAIKAKSAGKKIMFATFKIIDDTIIVVVFIYTASH